jgi:hypothetical protein
MDRRDILSLRYRYPAIHCQPLRTAPRPTPATPACVSHRSVFAHSVSFALPHLIGHCACSCIISIVQANALAFSPDTIGCHLLTPGGRAARYRTLLHPSFINQILIRHESSISEFFCIDRWTRLRQNDINQSSGQYGLPLYARSRPGRDTPAAKL